MTDALLDPPARVSHALMLALVFAIAGLLSVAIGHLPTLVVGLGTLVAFLVAFWAFSRDAWAFTALGTGAMAVASIGVLVTTLWAVLGAIAGPGAGAVLLSLAVSLSVLGGVVAVVLGLVPSRVTDQDGPALTALLAIAGLSIAFAVVIVAIRLGLAGLFGTSVSSLMTAAREVSFGAMSTNSLTNAGSLGLLAGAGLWYAARLAGLPLSRRLGRGVWVRWAMLVEREVLPDLGIVPRADSETNEHREAGSLPDLFGIDPRWGNLPRWLGAGLFYLGFGALAFGLTPEFQSVADELAIVETLGSILGSSVAVQQLLVDLLVWMVGLRIGHATAWRGLHVDWTTNRARLGYGGGAMVVVLLAATQGRTVVDFLRSTPAFQLVPMGDSGPVVVATEAGVEFAAASGLTIEPRPAVFSGWFDGFVTLLGPAVFGIAALAVVVLLGTVLLIIATIFVAGPRLSRPGAGVGLLFVASAGAAVLGAGEVIAFAGGAGALVAWELYTYGGSLSAQLDAEASTVTAELVHLGASLVLVGAAVLMTLLGVRVVGYVPSPAETWQGVGALTLSLSALALGLLYLGLRDDGRPMDEG